MHSDSRNLRDLCKNICLGNVLKRCAATASLGGNAEGGGRSKIRDSSVEGPDTPMHDSIGPGHDLWQVGAIYFCRRCACHGDIRAKGLLHACDADPAKLRSKATILNRLQSGLHPRTKAFVGVPVRALNKNRP